jgi:hypothetical protein
MGLDQQRQLQECLDLAARTSDPDVQKSLLDAARALRLAIVTQPPKPAPSP